MRRENLFRLFEEAHRLCGHQDFVVIGSLSILGVDDEDVLPADMTMSIDVDTFTKADPGRIFDLEKNLGRKSLFYEDFGFYLDPVSPAVASLPDGWEDRMIRLDHGPVRIWFVEPNDSAVSKYARGDTKDLRWIRAGIIAGYVLLPTVVERIRLTTFLDSDEELRVKDLVAADEAWFVLQTTRSTHKI